MGKRETPSDTGRRPRPLHRRHHGPDLRSRGARGARGRRRGARYQRPHRYPPPLPGPRRPPHRARGVRTLEGVEISYIGDGNNVAHSLALGCALTGARLTIAHPSGHGPDPAIMELAGSLGAAPTLTEDPREAASGARVIYTDVWASMGQEDEAAERRQKFALYQVNDELMSLANEDAIFLHCLPAHRGEEVTAQVIDGPAEPGLRSGREPAARSEGAAVSAARLTPHQRARTFFRQRARGGTNRRAQARAERR